MNIKKNQSNIYNTTILASVSLLSVTIISGFLLSSTITHADGNTSSTDAVSITVDSACTMTGGPTGESTTDNTYTATIDPGTYSEISGSKLVTVCNDSLGYSIYAIGFSGDSYDTDNTKLLGQGTIAGTNINTGTSGSNSYWAMKLEAVTGVTPPTILNSFDNYHVIPDTYTQIAKQTTATASPSDTGASVQTKYKVNVSSAQTAGIYTGKVKYTMVHPNTAPAPKPQPAPPTSCNTPVPNATYMQDITPTTKASVLASLTEDAPYYIRDNRDEEPYCVSKLKDDNLWMLDNLRLDLGNSTVLNNTTESNTNASTTTLNYLKNGGGSTSDRYPTAKINNVAWTSSSQNYYSIPMTISTYKDQTTTSYGEGSGKIGVYYNYCAASAGNYCFGNGTSYGSPSGNATEDICPKGWRMPTGGSSGEYQALYTAYSSDATSFKNALSTPLSGNFLSGSASGQGTGGLFWSSTYGNANGMYYLVVNSSNVGPSYSLSRYYGSSVRCLLGS